MYIFTWNTSNQFHVKVDSMDLILELNTRAECAQNFPPILLLTFPFHMSSLRWHLVMLNNRCVPGVLSAPAIIRRYLHVIGGGDEDNTCGLHPGGGFAVISAPFKWTLLLSVGVWAWRRLPHVTATHMYRTLVVIMVESTSRWRGWHDHVSHTPAKVAILVFSFDIVIALLFIVTPLSLSLQITGGPFAWQGF